MIDQARLINILVQGGSFVAAFAAIAAGVIMANVRSKFGTGILAQGFKSISTGVFFIAGGIIVDAIQTYLQSAGNLLIPVILLVLKELLFVIGTYIIVIGSKKTGDNLESLTK